MDTHMYTWQLHAHCAIAWCLCVCMYVAVRAFYRSDRELSCLANLHGDMSCSLPGNLGHPQSYTALYKSLKYSTCTVVVTVQKYTSTLCLCLSLRTSFPACSRVWELCVLFLPRDCSGTQQSGQGKTVHLPFIIHYIFCTDAVCRPLSKSKVTPPSVHAFLPQMAPMQMWPIQAMTVRRIRIHEKFQQPVFAGNVLLM